MRSIEINNYRVLERWRFLPSNYRRLFYEVNRFLRLVDDVLSLIFCSQLIKRVGPEPHQYEPLDKTYNL